jgi:hypothetical protein
VVSGVVHGVDLLVHFMNWLNGPEDVFYDAYEALTPLQKLFTDYEAVLSEMLPYGDSFSGALKRIMEKNQQIIKEKGATKETLDLLFSNIDKTIEETTLRKIDLTDFSKLPDPLKAKIVDAWKNAKSQDLVEALVNLQAKDIDKGLLEVIGKNAEWKELKPEELIQIPEALYEFLSITTLAQIEKALKATPKDFDTINKLTTLSFVTDNAWKNATAQELLDFPTEFYTELSEAHLKQIEKQINLTDAQLPLEAQINNPYQKQITLLEVEQAKRASAINNDSQSIQKQAADAQKQQADQVAQHTATTPTQTTPETSGTATNQELPNFDTIPSRPRSDSTTSADFHDPHETAEEFQKAHEKELLEKQAQEEAAKKRAEQAIKEHEIAAEHAATQVHGL